MNYSLRLKNTMVYVKKTLDNSQLYPWQNLVLYKPSYFGHFCLQYDTLSGDVLRYSTLDLDNFIYKILLEDSEFQFTCANLARVPTDVNRNDVGLL